MQYPLPDKPGFFVVRTRCPKTMFLIRGRIDRWLENRGMKRAEDGWWESGQERVRVEQLPDGIGELVCALLRPLSAVRSRLASPLALAA